MRVCKVLFVSLFLVYIIQPGEGRRSRKSRIEGTYVCKSKKTCLPNSKCSGKYKSVLWEQICDGTRQCPCGDDEQHCAPDCPGQYQCANSTCIHSNNVCNGENDCSSGEDETNCPLPTPPPTTCPPTPPPTTCPPTPAPTSCPPTTPPPTCPTTTPTAPCPEPPCICYKKACFKNFSYTRGGTCPPNDFEILFRLDVTLFNFEMKCQTRCDSSDECIGYIVDILNKTCSLSRRTIDEIVQMDNANGAGNGCVHIEHADCTDTTDPTTIQFLFLSKIEN